MTTALFCADLRLNLITTAISKYELGGSRSASALAPGLTQGPLECTQVYVAGQRAKETGGRGTGER